MSAHRNAPEPAPEGAWFKSSYSDQTGGTCVEVAHLPPAQVGVRDSKRPTGPALSLAPQAFTAFLGHVKTARTDPAVRTGG